MRKVTAILLILLLFFNWYGYRIVISVIQNGADHKLESRIDKSDYDESQLIEIKVALNMPYQERVTGFERQYGEIEIEGKSYTYVKRRVAGDVVIFKCIANKTKQELVTMKNDWAKTNSGIDTDQRGKQQRQSSFAKNFWNDYDGQNAVKLLNKPSFICTTWLSGYSFNLPEGNMDTPYQPPKC